MLKNKWRDKNERKLNYSDIQNVKSITSSTRAKFSSCWVNFLGVDIFLNQICSLFEKNGEKHFQLYVC